MLVAGSAVEHGGKCQNWKHMVEFTKRIFRVKMLQTFQIFIYFQNEGDEFLEEIRYSEMFVFCWVTVCLGGILTSGIDAKSNV